MPLKTETHGIRKVAEDEAFKAYGSSDYAIPARNTFFSAFLAGAAWQRELDAEVARKNAKCSFHECPYCADGASAAIRAQGSKQENSRGAVAP